MSQTPTLPCPSCGSKIPFDTKALMLGLKFSCPNCDVKIGLSAESKPAVEETMKKFENLKKSSKKNNNF